MLMSKNFKQIFACTLYWEVYLEYCIGHLLLTAWWGKGFVLMTDFITDFITVRGALGEGGGAFSREVINERKTELSCYY